MKKSLLVIIFVLTGLNVFSQNAFIDQLTGAVEVKQPGENTFKAANKGEQIFQDTVISTGFKSYAIVKTGSTTITVRPLTALSLTEIQKSGEAEILNVNLQSGRVRVDVKPPSGTKASATLTSQLATASVRGTSFEFDTNNLYVNEGTVSFTGNKGQSILVSAGENSHVEQGQATTPREERNSNLIPPSPVGTSAGDTLFPGPASAGVNFSLTLEFH